MATRAARAARRRARRNGTGFTTVQYVLASGFALVLLVFAANLIVDLYLRAAVRDALDEGVRAGVPIGEGAPQCSHRAAQVLADLARGRLGRGVRLSCRERDGWIEAEAEVTLPSFLPALVPARHLTMRAAARREPS
jgi:hypothetical protein